MDHRPNVRAKIIKPLEKNIEVNLCDLGLVNYFLIMTSKTQITKEKMDKLTQSKFKNFGGFPGGAVVENLPANAGDTGSGPGLGGSHMPRSN